MPHVPEQPLPRPRPRTTRLLGGATALVVAVVLLPVSSAAAAVTVEDLGWTCGRAGIEVYLPEVWGKLPSPGLEEITAIAIVFREGERGLQPYRAVRARVDGDLDGTAGPWTEVGSGRSVDTWRVDAGPGSYAVAVDLRWATGDRLVLNSSARDAGTTICAIPK
jgi:hypothetical protein